MNPVGSVTSNQSTALMLLQLDTSLKPRPGQEDAETDPVPLAAVTAIQVLDPRSSLSLSTQASDAILSLVHKMPHHRSNVGLLGGIDESAMLTDEAFAKTMANTPAHYIEMMKSMGATRWVWRPEVHLTGVDFYKALSRAIPRDYNNPGSMANAIFIDKAAKIVRATDVPDAKIVSGYYDMYNDRNDHIGTVRRTECDPDYLAAFSADNPGLRIAPVYFGNDAALVIWPDVSDRQTGLRSLMRLRSPNA
ncbi:hypothetical protein [Methylobacterium brachiatum]|uniref:hypothetical protein n=1 Tax=Methylobacterium brachiatum TaxID=269660 RepID=UPI0008EFFFB1|nr:hypothetical protein [Methylobacterium brachiatum]SFI42620.1 hypothetical protein SAMN02799642_01823 [Methylobacterium brachiatum]